MEVEIVEVTSAPPSPPNLYRRFFRIDRDQTLTRQNTFLDNRLRYLRRTLRSRLREEGLNAEETHRIRLKVAETKRVKTRLAASQCKLLFKTSDLFAERDTNFLCRSQLVYVSNLHGGPLERGRLDRVFERTWRIGNT